MVREASVDAAHCQALTPVQRSSRPAHFEQPQVCDQLLSRDVQQC